MSTVSLNHSAALQRNAPLLDGLALRHQARHSAGNYAVVASGTNRPVFEGVVDTVQLADGLSLHRVDARDLQGVAVHATLQPGLRIALTVGGKADVSYGGHRLMLGPRSNAQAAGAVVALTQPVAFARQSRRGDLERSVSLTVSETWLEQRLGESLPRCLAFAREHLSIYPWEASSLAVSLAEQILAPPTLDGALGRIYQESRCLALIAEAMTSLSGAVLTPAIKELRQRDRTRMEQVREWLDSGHADGMSLAQIASQACLSVNTLQRHFRAIWGKTVFAYLRDVRLDRARMALERDEVSVTEAALIAGYSSPANFATAFRQRYGMPPGQAGRAGYGLASP